MAVVTYLSNSEPSDYNSTYAVKLLLVFAVLNVLEIGFWLWGLLTMSYENGDKIRDSILDNNKEDTEHQSSIDPYEEFAAGQNIGTIEWFYILCVKLFINQWIILIIPLWAVFLFYTWFFKKSGLLRSCLRGIMTCPCSHPLIEKLSHNCNISQLSWYSTDLPVLLIHL